MSAHSLITVMLVASFVPIIGALQCIDYWDSHIAHVNPRGDNNTAIECAHPGQQFCFATKCLYKNNPNQWMSIKGCIDKDDPAYCVNYAHRWIFERLRDNGELGRLILKEFRCVECNFAGDQENLPYPDIMPAVTTVEPEPSILTGTSVEPEPRTDRDQHSTPSPPPMSKSAAYIPKATSMMMMMIDGLLAMTMGIMMLGPI